MKNSQKMFYAAKVSDFNSVLMSPAVYTEWMEYGSNKCGVGCSNSEKKSWKQNKDALSVLFREAQLPDDVIVGFEYQIPISGSRIDCMLFGKGKDGKKNIVHIELKQWSNKNVERHYDNYVFKVAVEGYSNGSQITSHPSAQVAGYHNCLLNYIKAFGEKDISLHGIAYCYNYIADSEKKECALLDDYYKKLTNIYPLFCIDQMHALAEKLNDLLCQGEGEEIYDDLLNSEIGPTQRLYDVAAEMLNNSDNSDNRDNRDIFTLVGDQIDVYNDILGTVKNTPKDEKAVVIVKGGPGTGKSVLALKLLSKLYDKEYNCKNVYYATRSTSLKDGLQNILKGVAIQNNKGTASELVRPIFDIRPYLYHNENDKPIENEGDVVIIDEAHRISYKSGNDSDSHRDIHYGTYLSQIMSILYTSRVSVFFIDDKQGIKTNEIGLSSEIRNAAEEYVERLEREKDEHIKSLPKYKKKLEEKEREFNQLSKMPQTEDVIKRMSSLMEGEYGIPRLKKKINFTLLDSSINKIPTIHEFELTDQFRCNGANNYLNWIDSVLYGEKNVVLNKDAYEFAICDTPQELVAKIRSLDDYARFEDAKRQELGEKFLYKTVHDAAGNSVFNQKARIVAGWCWDWKGKIQKDGDLKGDLLYEVTIPEYNFAMPWETKEKGIKPKGDFKFKYASNEKGWCNENQGVNQIGCIHSIQGWETDYVGVIIGPDLRFDKTTGKLRYNPKGNNQDLTAKSDAINDQLILNTYRVLLTRGKKGCFVFACDPDVKDYLLKHL